MRHVVDAIAAQGRNGDDELLHISKRELRDLKTIGDAIGIKTTVNPKTGIHEAFNWGKMLATGVGGTLGFVASGFNPMGAAAGAALASGAYTGAEGGSTQDVLMNAAISGATAYAGAGIAQGLGEAGAAAAEPGTEIVKGGVQGATDTASQTGLQELAKQGTQNSGILQNLTEQGGEKLVTEGSSRGMGSVVGDKFVPNPAPPLMSMPGSTGAIPYTGSDILKGFQNTSGKDLLSQYGGSAMKTGVGLATLGAMPSNYNTDTSTTSSTGSNVKAETYVTPDGQRRTRIVGMADGGPVHSVKGGKSDLDVEALESPAARMLRNTQVNGGGFAENGITGLGGRIGYGDSIGERGHLSGGVTGNVARMHFDGTDPVVRGAINGADITYSTPERSISVRYDNRAPAVTPSNFGPMDAQAMMHMGPLPQARDRFSVNYRQNFEEGGLASMARGRYLQGPGDGMSDSIPAEIDGKQQARLATGEFVVPADVVSGLGNGDSTSGAKQLHSMMDRVRMDRTGTKKQGKQINPRKLMPA